jgi:predicted acyltransferase
MANPELYEEPTMASLVTDQLTAPEPTLPPLREPSASPAAPESKPARLLSLDAYRGLIMIVLATSGLGFTKVYQTLQERSSDVSPVWRFLAFNTDHVPWIGCSFWDLIQPSFMFMVGVAVPYSLASRRAKGDSGPRTWAHVVWRAVLLILLGVFLSSNGTPRTNWTFVNVLTQIGLGYVFLCLLAGRGVRVQSVVLAVILAGYWLLFFLWPPPPKEVWFHDSAAMSGSTLSFVAQSHLHQSLGAGPAAYAMGAAELAVTAPEGFDGIMRAGWTPAWRGEEGLWAHWDKNTNAAAAFDSWFLPQFPPKALDKPFVFNEGGYQTLNFIPSLATMLMGLMAGELLRGRRRPESKLLILIAAAAVCMGVGWLAGETVCPLVKRIWTPSWAVFSTGWCFTILATLFAIIDVAGWRRWALPLVIVGMNSIAMYVMIQLMGGWVGDSWMRHLPGAWFQSAYAPILRAGLIAATLWLICAWMYRRGIFLRI